MGKCNFTPCATCNMPCNKARGPQRSEENKTAIEREIEITDFKRNGCPYTRKKSTT